MSSLFYKYQSIKEATDLAVDEVCRCETLLDAILGQVVLDTIKRYQQKLSVGVEDSAQDLLDNFKLKITQTIFEVAESWQQANEGNRPILFPRGCRFCYSRGENTILVIEQDPQVRTVLFESGMGVTSPGSTAAGDERWRLSLPYSIFLLHFRNARFINLYCGWRTRPLASLDDLIAKPVLPNIHENLNVCMRWTPSNTNIVEQTEQVLTRFWNSKFNNDLSTTWWRKSQIDPRISSAEAWQELSESDPMFVLSLRFDEERSLQRMLDLMTSAAETVDESAFRHRLSEEINQCVEGLFSKITQYFRKTKFEKHYPKEIRNSFKESMRASLKELVDLVFALEVELRDLSAQLKRNPALSQPRSRFWQEYEES